MSITGFPVLFLFCCAGLVAQSAGFAGIAVNSVTGQPLSGVHVKLSDLDSIISGGVPDVYGAMSGRDGRFSVTGVPPGTYALFTERAGFVQMTTAKGTLPVATVALKPGERVAEFRLEMTPRAVIAGRVVDEYGDPVPNVPVQVTAVEPGGPTALGAHLSASTNTRGEFRVVGGPGTFYVKATPGPSNQTPEIRTDGTSDAAYGATWYPMATSADRASIVAAQAGADVTGIEIRLTRQRSITIAGAVFGAPAGTSPMIYLASGDSPERIVANRAISAGPDGRFRASKLAVAFYRVWASAGNLRSQVVAVEPDGPDVVDAQLVLTTGAEVTGTVEITGDPPRRPTEKVTVSLGPASGATDSDGSFKVAGVYPDLYRVDVRPLPENCYVRAVELNGAMMPGTEVDLSRGAQDSRLKITLARDGAQLSGTVLDTDGRPLGSTLAIVILAPDRDHIYPDQDGRVKEGGKYNLNGIRPGKYILFAVDILRSGPLSGLDDLKKLASAGEEIEIKAGEKITRDLKALNSEDSDARSKK